MFVWNTNSIATSLCYKQYFGCAVDLSGIAYNGSELAANRQLVDAACANLLLGGAVDLCGWLCFGLSFFERWKC